MNKLTVLIVDDAKFMRVTIRRILSCYDVEIIGEAENGLRAVELFSMFKPSLIIMDVAMPVMDGIEAITRIIKIDASANIIVCSTLGDRQKVIEAIKEGAATYILKPPHEEKLIAEINAIFGDDTLVKNEKLKITEDDITEMIPSYNTDYEIGYRDALVKIAKKLIADNIEISKICYYLEITEELLKEENIIT